MDKKHGLRYCGECNSKLQKNGKNRNGKQRWRCIKCNSSKIDRRIDLQKYHQLVMFSEWLLDKQTASQNSSHSRATFYRQTSWCWSLSPQIEPSVMPSKYIIVDSTYIGRNNCCSIVINDKFVLSSCWSTHENMEAYRTVFKNIPEPEFVICDGNPGCIKAIRYAYKTAKIQRCLFHIKLFATQKLSRKPKTRAGTELLEIVYGLLKVETLEQAQIWILYFEKWCAKYDGLLKERTYNTAQNGVKNGRKWWYTHRNLRAVKSHVRNALDDDQLFHFLSRNIPKTSNKLEGGINARLKELRRCHRGISLEHEKKLFDWYLLSKSELGVENFIKKSTQNAT